MLVAGSALRNHGDRLQLLGIGIILAIHIGTSGWSYDHWENVLYPGGCPPAHRLGHYVRRFSTVELNSSFYRWPELRRSHGGGNACLKAS